MQRLLIYDHDRFGHHVEHLRHLADYVAWQRPGIAVTMAVHPDIAADPALKRAVEASEGNLSTVLVSERMIGERPGWRGLVERSMHAWERVARITQECEVDHCILMHLNLFQFALGTKAARQVPFTISGIYFHPYTRIQPHPGSLLSVLGTRLKKARKIAQLAWMLRNKQITDIFLLNDHKAADQLNRRFMRKGTFQYLLDPVPPLGEPEESPFNLDKIYQLDRPRRRIFLHFGSLDRRKGTLQVLKALLHLSPEERSKVALLLLGIVQDGLKDVLPQELSSTQQTCPEAQIVLDDRFFSDHEMNAAFDQCDVVLVPYLRTEGSSGVLGHAARAKKPVIGPNRGLVSDLITRYSLGLTVDSDSPEHIANGIRTFLQPTHGIVNADRMDAYINERTFTAFAERMLSAVTGSGELKAK